MRQRYIAGIFVTLLLVFLCSAPVTAKNDDHQDTDTRMVDAKVVEVNDAHISVIARTGVEHVIAIDRTDTKVTINGQVVSLKDLREGDVVTVELDANKQVKFAKNILMESNQVQLARNRR